MTEFQQKLKQLIKEHTYIPVSENPSFEDLIANNEKTFTAILKLFNDEVIGEDEYFNHKIRLKYMDRDELRQEMRQKLYGKDGDHKSNEHTT